MDEVYACDRGHHNSLWNLAERLEHQLQGRGRGKKNIVHFHCFILFLFLLKQIRVRLLVAWIIWIPKGIFIIFSHLNRNVWTTCSFNWLFSIKVSKRKKCQKSKFKRTKLKINIMFVTNDILQGVNTFVTGCLLISIFYFFFTRSPWILIVLHLWPFCPNFIKS